MSTAWYLCVLDFEATCWEGSVNKNSMEIIEFPSVLFKVTEVVTERSTGGGEEEGPEDEEEEGVEQIAEFAEYVRPTIVPTLTAFCTELTGIEQATVDCARTFKEVYKSHIGWLHEHVPYGAPLVIATCGHWDLRTQLPRELCHKGLAAHKFYASYVNVKDEFETFYATKAKSMPNMLNFLALPLEGRHHSGIDDTRNIAKIMLRILADGRRFADLHIHKV